MVVGPFQLPFLLTSSPGGGELSVFRGGRFFLVLQGVLGLLSLLDGGRFSWFLTGVMPLVVWGGSRFLAMVLGLFLFRRMEHMAWS